jgi:hypothetical protein
VTPAVPRPTRPPRRRLRARTHSLSDLPTMDPCATSERPRARVPGARFGREAEPPRGSARFSSSIKRARSACPPRPALSATSESKRARGRSLLRCLLRTSSTRPSSGVQDARFAMAKEQSPESQARRSLLVLCDSAGPGSPHARLAAKPVVKGVRCAARGEDGDQRPPVTTADPRLPRVSSTRSPLLREVMPAR